MAVPSVYTAINAIASDLARKGIAKTHTHEVDGYSYRSIDDIVDRIAPLLAAHGLCIFPHVLERTCLERQGENRLVLLNVVVRMAFGLVSVSDGSAKTVEVYGEAEDVGDKATAKAMSAAYKTALVQTFCIPGNGAADSEMRGQKELPKHCSEPVQGWSQWCQDIESVVQACESEQAILLVQNRNRNLLQALAREQPRLYATLGATFANRREALVTRTCVGTCERSTKKRVRKSERATSEAANA